MYQQHCLTTAAAELRLCPATLWCCEVDVDVANSVEPTSQLFAFICALGCGKLITPKLQLTAVNFTLICHFFN